MGQHTIKRICGCVETLQLKGAKRDRNRLAAYEATKLCVRCAGLADVVSEESGSDNPVQVVITGTQTPLTGPDKRMSWATTIRREAVAAGKIEATQAIAKALTRSEKMHIAQAYQDAFAEALSHTTAAWWIDSIDSIAEPTILIRCVARERLILRAGVGK